MISGIACASTTTKKGAKSDDFAIESMRKKVLDESQLQRFIVSRLDGMEELKRDILGYYKDKACKLTAKPRVKFEGEEGVGSSPVREFLLCAMKIVQEGIGGTGKPVIFFEGEEDHKVPIHDRSLRSTGAFKAIGRIIGHSLLHGSPLLYGLSPVVKTYWRATASESGNDFDAETLHSCITLEDIPDIELRGYISEVIIP